MFFYQILIYSFKGGPLVWESDGKLIGVMSSYVKYTKNEHKSTNLILQIFMNIPYYYAWIEHITGLELTKCNGPQASSFAE